MAAQKLSTAMAKKFFKSLYASPAAGVRGEFDAIVTRLVARLGKNVVAGDQALQSLMINYVLSNPKNVQKGHRISASLAGIKQRSVNDFVKTFPTADLKSLIQAAKNAGYKVEVLKA